MVLVRERTRSARRITGVAALCFLVLNGWALAQTQQQKNGRPAAPPPSQAQQAPSLQALPSKWTAACSDTSKGFECRAAQTMVYQQGQRRIQVGAILRLLPDNKKPNLLLRLPLGVKLGPGVTIRVGESQAKAIAFESCNLNGCLAEYPITSAEISSLQKGADLALSIRTAQNAPIKFTLPAAGFATAYAKVTGK